MPIWIIGLLENVIPPIVGLIIRHYEKKEQTPEVQIKLQAHQDALAALKGLK